MLGNNPMDKTQKQRQQKNTEEQHKHSKTIPKRLNVIKSSIYNGWGQQGLQMMSGELEWAIENKVWELALSEPDSYMINNSKQFWR